MNKKAILHIFEALRWHRNITVILKDGKGKPIVTIDNDESKLILWMNMIEIKKVKGISDLIKNQFHIKDHRKTNL